ncbi:MAG: hypothetical protein IIC04_01445 [Proteobacteria bacterium]|nr:hypothetical protein [Pseudomonadota bacterium]
MDEFISGRPAAGGRWAWAALAALPVAYVAVTLVLRAHTMPFWLWHNLDPDYFYLLDSLNILNLTTPGHVYHPGTTVQWLGALVKGAWALLLALAVAQGAGVVRVDGREGPEPSHGGLSVRRHPGRLHVQDRGLPGQRRPRRAFRQNVLHP